TGAVRCVRPTATICISVSPICLGNLLGLCPRLPEIIGFLSLRRQSVLKPRAGGWCDVDNKTDSTIEGGMYMSEQSRAPETLEGWFALHDIRLFDRAAWQALDESARHEIAAEASAFFSKAAEVADAAEGASGLYTVLGHKGDI